MRKTDRYPVDGPNALWQIYRTVSKWKAVKNFVWIQISRYCPSLPVKNWIYRRMLGMEVGEHTAFALMVMVDVFFRKNKDRPQLDHRVQHHHSGSRVFDQGVSSG